MSASFIKLIITFFSKLCLLKKKKITQWSNMNKKDKYFWRIQNWKWVFSGLYFARPLTYQPIKNTKVEKNYIKLVFSIFSLGIERTKHQKSWSFTKAGWCVMCVRNQIVTFFRGKEKGEHCSFYYTQITHIKSPYLRPFSAIVQKWIVALCTNPRIQEWFKDGLK